jgi:NAD(P)-dependent dehydrogenase (short-subunit alcohol dehydrogenase family)
VKARLEGKRAVIVGAGQSPGQTIGMGRAIAIVFAEQGADIVLVDRDHTSALETSDQIVQRGSPEPKVAICDITQPADCAEVAASVRREFGGLDAIGNSVGILGMGDALTTTDDLWDRVLSTNLTGMWRITKALLPLMLPNGGAIVNVSSIGAVAGSGLNTSYEVSKAGVSRLTLALAAAYAKDDVRANALLPGLIDTPMAVDSGADLRGITRDEYLTRRNNMVPMRYKGSAFDVAQAACFLSSDDSRYISGALIPIDGALMAASYTVR